MNVLEQLGAEFAQVAERDARELAVHSGRRRTELRRRRPSRRGHGLFATVLVLGLGGGATGVTMLRDGHPPSNRGSLPSALGPGGGGSLLAP